jgi:hypothetical protein
MNRLIKILLTIILLQLLVFLYIKFFHETDHHTLPSSCETVAEQVELDTLIRQSINEIVNGSKELPQSSEYTIWDKRMIAKLNKEIEVFNENIKRVVEESISIEKLKMEEKSKKEEIKIAQKEKPKPQISTAFKITEFAKNKLGTQYVWGATGPNKFDCSGFTREVYKSTTGIKIPRVSRDQAKVGTYVEFSDLRRGDMVFFDTEKRYTGTVNHVGIYLSNDNFIHASSARKKVIITNFKKKPFYKKRFLWGRRIVKNVSPNS